MKKLKQLFFALLCLTTFNVVAQDSYFENFDTLAPGSLVGRELAPVWRTWSSPNGGGSEDAKVTTERSFSPNNSVRIKNTVPNGGPEDLVLNLGGRRTTGTMRMGWKVFIPQDSGAYWNFQSTTNPGDSFAMELLVTTDGVLNINAGGAWNAKTIPFPIGEWVDFKAEVDIDNNLWTFFVNDVCGGVYRSSLRGLASVDFFAISGGSYFLDDVFYEYSPDVKTFDVEGGILNLVVTGGRQIAGEEIGFRGTFYNAGRDTITQIVYAVNNSGTTVYDTIDVTILPRRSLTINLPLAVALVDGNNNLNIDIVSVNGQTDAVGCNNNMSAVVFAVEPAEHRKVLLEEGTGTWCGWCPRGAVFLDFISPLYDEYLIPIAVHNQDPMVVTAYDQRVGSFPGFTGYPGMIVDRREVQDPSTSLAPALRYLKEEPGAIITIGARKNDADSTKLDVSVTFNFLKDIPAGYGMLLTLSENGVKGTTAGYNQANYYSGGNSGAMGGYENRPNPVPAAQMVYDHVARTYDVRSGFAAYSAGDSLTANFTIAMNSGWKQENIKIVAALLENTGKVSNANDATIADAEEQGYTLRNKEGFITSADLQVYPNPASGIASVALSLANSSDINILLIDAQGRTVSQQQYSRLSGDVVIPVSVADLTPGIYTVLARTSSGLATTKLTIVK